MKIYRFNRLAKKLCYDATNERTMEKYEDSSDILYVFFNFLH